MEKKYWTKKWKSRRNLFFPETEEAEVVELVDTLS